MNYYYGNTFNGTLFTLKSNVHVTKDMFNNVKFLVAVNKKDYIKLWLKTPNHRKYVR